MYLPRSDGQAAACGIALLQELVLDHGVHALVGAVAPGHHGDGIRPVEAEVAVHREHLLRGRVRVDLDVAGQYRQSPVVRLARLDELAPTVHVVLLADTQICLLEQHGLASASGELVLRNAAAGVEHPDGAANLGLAVVDADGALILLRVHQVHGGARVLVATATAALVAPAPAPTSASCSVDGLLFTAS